MRIDKNGEKITKNISFMLQFIDSARFMASSLSNFINNLFEGIHRIKYKFGRSDKKYETSRIKYKHATIFWNMQIKSLIHTNKTLIHTNLLTMTAISLFYCCKKVFIFMNRWIIGKNSMKLYCLKKSLKYERYY